MTIQVEDIIRWVDNLEDEDLSSYTKIQVRHWLEFFKLREGRSVFNWDNLQYRDDILWAVYSPVEDLYYLRSTRDRWDGDSASKRLKTYYTDDNLYILLSEAQMEELKDSMARSYRHYTKEKGTFKYREFYALMRLHIERDDYLYWYRGEEGYKTKVRQFDNQIKQIINGNKNKQSS